MNVELIVAFEHEVMRAEVGKDGIRALSRLALPKLQQVIVCDDHILACCSDGIHVLDRTLQHRAGLPFEECAAVAASPDVVYVCAEGSIIEIDWALSELGRTVLLDGKKNAHDILRHGSLIYMLDNVLWPVFVLIARRFESKTTRVISKAEITSVTPHLDAQFIDPAQRKWYVLSSFAHRGGSGQVLHTFSADAAREMGEGILLCSEPHFPEAGASPQPVHGYAERVRLEDKGDDGPPPGLRLHATSAILPCMVVASHPGALGQEPEYYVGKLGSDRDGLYLEELMPLSFGAGVRAPLVRQRNGRAYVVAERIREGEQPELVCAVFEGALGSELVATANFADLGAHSAGQLVAFEVWGFDV